MDSDVSRVIAGAERARYPESSTPTIPGYPVLEAYPTRSVEQQSKEEI